MSRKLVREQSIFQLAWPIFLQTLLALSLGYVDSIMLSRYSQRAVGAIGNANQIVGFLTLMFSIISSATSVVLSQYIGAKQYKKLNQIYTVSIGFNLFISLFISLLLLFFSQQLLLIMNVPMEMFSDANRYMKIVGGFIFTQALFDTFGQIFRSNGQTLIGMVLALIMNMVNIIGNYLFLYGPFASFNLGAAGVAVSTTLSRIVALVIAIYFFYRHIHGKLSFKYLRPFPIDILSQLLKIGIPTAGENISFNVSQMVITMFINTLGSLAITTKIYVTILSNFSYLYSVSVSIATAILVGHAIGNFEEDRAYHLVLKSLKMALIVSVLIASVNAWISPVTLGLFTNDASVIALGSTVMIIAVFLEIGRTCNLVVINSMKAAGDAKFPTLVGIVSMWLISVVIGYILAFHFKLGLVGFWIGMAMDEMTRGVIMTTRWICGGWRNRRLVKE